MDLSRRFHLGEWPRSLKTAFCCLTLFHRSSKIQGLYEDLRLDLLHLKQERIESSSIRWSSTAIQWLSGTNLITSFQSSSLISSDNLALPSGVIFRYSCISQVKERGLVRRDSTARTLLVGLDLTWPSPGQERPLLVFQRRRWSGPCYNSAE